MAKYGVYFVSVGSEKRGGNDLRFFCSRVNRGRSIGYEKSGRMERFFEGRSCRIGLCVVRSRRGWMVREDYVFDSGG